MTDRKIQSNVNQNQRGPKWGPDYEKDSMIKGKCGVAGCQADIKPAADRVAFARNLGLHKRIAHGIKGPTGRERYYIQFKGMTLEQARAEVARRDSKNGAPTKAVQDRRAYQAQWRKNHPKHRKQPNSDAVSAKLSECPCCGSRFYYVEGAA